MDTAKTLWESFTGSGAKKNKQDDKEREDRLRKDREDLFGDPHEDSERLRGSVWDVMPGLQRGVVLRGRRDNLLYTIACACCPLQ